MFMMILINNSFKNKQNSAKKCEKKNAEKSFC
jgi:hypothetical protein